MQQVANMRLAGRQQRIGLHVPGADGQPPLADAAGQLVAPRGTNRQVVLEEDALAIEQEAEVAIGGE